MTTGVKATTLDSASLIDEVLGNRQGSTSRISTENLAAQMAAAGPLADLITSSTVLAQTWSDLSGKTGAFDGQGGEVLDSDAGTHSQATSTGYNGATVNNAGRYSWSAAWSRWVRIGSTGLAGKADQDDLEAVESRLLPTVLAAQDPAIRDLHGILSGVAGTLYLPRRIYHQRDGEVTNVTVANAASSALPNHCAITLDIDAASFVYLDLSDDTFKVESYSTPAIDMKDEVAPDIIPVAIDWRGNTVCMFEFIDTEAPEGAALWPIRPLIVERGALLVPAFFARVPLSDFTSGHVPPGNVRYWEIPRSEGTGSGDVETFYWDHAEYVRTGARVISRAIGVADRHMGGYGSMVLARASAQGVSSPHPLAGDVPGGAVPNQTAHGADADAMPIRFGTTVVGDVTDPDLVALGFSRGATDPVTRRPYYGDYMVHSAGRGRGFARVYVQTDTAGVFGAAQLYLWNATGARQTVPLSREKQISETAAIYSASFILADRDDFASFLIGMEPSGGAIFTICGAQFHSGTSPAWWIMRDDYPVATSDVAGMQAAYQQGLYGAVGDPSAFGACYPPDLWTLSGRELPLYPPAIMRERGEGRAVQATLASESGAASGYLPYVITGRDELRIQPERLGSSVELTLRRLGSEARLNTRYRLPITAHVASAAQVGSVNVMCIGDSLTNREAPMRLGRKLENLGLTVNMIGTLENGGGGSYDGEGREGLEWADYTFEHDGDLSPVPPGGEATYLAYSETEKREWNPFLKEPTPSDISTKAAYIYNGQIFDMRYYLTRFGFADPTHVVINLGTNDISQQSEADALSQVQNGFNVLYNQIREALPTAQIGIVVTQLGRSSSADGRWDSDRWSTLILKQLALVTAARAGGDNRVWFLPAYAHMSWETGWGTTLNDTNANTRLETRTLSDPIHFEGHGREQLAELVAAWVAGTHEGV